MRPRIPKGLVGCSNPQSKSGQAAKVNRKIYEEQKQKNECVATQITVEDKPIFRLIPYTVIFGVRIYLLRGNEETTDKSKRYMSFTECLKAKLNIYYEKEEFLCMN